LSTSGGAHLIAEETSLHGYENRQKIRARIEKVKEISGDVKEITFRFITPEKVSYEAGQFILVKVQEDPLMYRAYSISSYDEDGTGLSITVKKAPKGYGTEIIFTKFDEGEEIDLEGPMGAELIIDKSAEKVAFVAGGIGITPFVPMVQEALKGKNSLQEVKLIYGVNQASEFMYDDYFNHMEKENERFKYEKVVASDDAWTGRKGFVTDVLKEMELEGYKIYMCGPKPMIGPTVKQLNNLGVSDDNIFYESA
jgi:NAD(P)H-flavin reductase